MVARFSKFYGKFELVFVLTLENAFSQRLHFKANRKSIGSLKSVTRDFLNSPPFERSACFYVTISGNFEIFQYLNFETNFFGKRKPFSKNQSNIFQLKVLKQPKQKPVVRQIEWSVQNGPITKKGDLPGTTFSFRTPYKELF